MTTFRESVKTLPPSDLPLRYIRSIQAEIRKFYFCSGATFPDVRQSARLTQGKKKAE